MPKSLLLCDDAVTIRRVAEFKLRGAGFDVRSAGDGEEAWALIQERLPDLLVTDLQMPRLDGFGLCRRVRANPATQHLPIIMLTAKGCELAPSETIEQFGLAKVMTKPFSPRELLQTVEELLAATPAS